MSALVALTRAVIRLGDARPAPFWALFQPSEEAHPLGAEMIVESGVLEGVRAVVAAHVHPGIPWGSIGADPGAVNAAADSLVFRITGPAGPRRLPAPRARSDPRDGRGHRRPAQPGRPPYRPAASCRRQRRRRARRRGRQRDPALRRRARDAADARRRRSADAARGGALADRGRPAARTTARSRSRSSPASRCSRTTRRSPGGVRALSCRRRASRSPTPWRSCGSDDFSFFSAIAPLLMAFVGLEGAPGFHVRPLHHPEFLPPEAAVSAVARTLAMSYLGAAAGLTVVEAAVVPHAELEPRARERARDGIAAIARQHQERASGGHPLTAERGGDALDRLQVHAVQPERRVGVGDDHEPCRARRARRRGSRRSARRPSRAPGPAVSSPLSR